MVKQWLGFHIYSFGHCPPQDIVRRNENKNAYCAVLQVGVRGYPLNMIAVSGSMRVHSAGLHHFCRVF
jgi:hypothetical protein